MTTTYDDSTTIDTIKAALSRGDLDDDLDAIEVAVKQRRRDIAAAIQPGAKGITQGLSPKYLNGAPVTVLGWERGNLILEIPEDWWRMNPQAEKYKRAGGVVHATPMCFKADP